MDKSKNYTLMCEEAEKIQKLWKPVIGDVYTSYEWKKVHIVEYDYDEEEVSFFGVHPYIWLPRQDQLQKIWLKEFNNLMIEDMVERFYDWMNSFTTHQRATRSTWSMEQLWLAFVMKEKYSKQWSTDKQKWKEEQS